MIFKSRIKDSINPKYFILLLMLWQAVSVFLMASGNWPTWVSWINLAVLMIFIALTDTFESLLLLTVSIPFFTALPNRFSDSLSMWRILFAWLFLMWFAKNSFKHRNLSFIKFLPWDRALATFAFFSLLITLLFAKFPAQGVKQLVFFINAALFYIVLANSIKTREQIVALVKYAVWALAIIIAVGFMQLIFTLFSDLGTFWVFWADNLSKLYYGNYFSQVALYSNSWFSFNGSTELRMFSIMPDSQSFAYMCVYGIGLGTAIIAVVHKKCRLFLWSGIGFAALALVLSGTRAVWAGMLAPFFATIIAFVKNIFKDGAKKFIWPFVFILALFAISPIINSALGFLRPGDKFKENLLGRAVSIYDLRETSNAGRLLIWKESLAYAKGHLWGVGLSNFVVALNSNGDYRTYEQAAGQINERYNLPQRYVSAHNLYLQIFVELGVLGLGLFAWFWLAVLMQLYGYLMSDKNKKDFLALLVFQFLLVVLWISAAGFFDITLFNDKVLMFFFLNLALCGVIINNSLKAE